MLAYDRMCLLKAEYAPCFLLKAHRRCRSIRCMDSVRSATVVTLVEGVGRERSVKPIRRLLTTLFRRQSVSSDWIHFCSRFNEQARPIAQRGVWYCRRSRRFSRSCSVLATMCRRASPIPRHVSGNADRKCNPLRARKMTAQLPAANVSEHPIFLDCSEFRAHSPLSERIDALTHHRAFVAINCSYLLKVRFQ